jgi:hypothetical protein
MATTTQANTGVVRAARPVDWSRWLAAVLALVLLGAGVALLAAELNLLPAAWQRPLAVVAPAAVMAAGAGLALWGGPDWRRSLPAFAVEQSGAACGELVVSSGGQDVTVQAFAGSSQLAVGEFPNPRGPQVELRGTAAKIVLDQRRGVAAFAGGPWRAALTKSVPWDLDLRATSGHLALNLRDLTVASLKVHSAYGNVDLTLPAQGPGELQLRLALGDLAVTVPEGVEARLRLKVGPLVSVSALGRRLISVAPNEWMTPLYPTTALRCTVLIDMTAGDLVLN